MEEKKILRPNDYEGLTTFRPPLCYELTGRSFVLVMDDGYTHILKFADRKTLTLKITEQAVEYDVPGNTPHEIPESEAHTYSYECLKADETTYFINFEEDDAPTHTARTYVLDLENMLVTGVRSYIGANPRLPRMTTTRFTFGAVRREDGTLNDIRHGYTTDLVGKAIHWNYARFDIVHVYSSERYFRVTFSKERIEKMRRDFPKPPEGFKMPVYEDDNTMIKIKDHLYLVNLSEFILCRRNGHGNSLLFVMDLNTLHDVGRSFGTNGDWGDENYTLGAFGELFDASETLAKDSTYYIR